MSETESVEAQDLVIAEAAKRQTAGERITDLQARVIAGRWNRGPNSPTEQFFRTGRICYGVQLNIKESQRFVPKNSTNYHALAGLLEYVRRTGFRQAVDGWNGPEKHHKESDDDYLTDHQRLWLLATLIITTM